MILIQQENKQLKSVVNEKFHFEMLGKEYNINGWVFESSTNSSYFDDDNTVRTYFESFEHKNKDGQIVQSVISKKVIFECQIEIDETGKYLQIENYQNGVKTSTEYYSWNEDNSYSVTTVIEGSNNDPVTKKYTSNGEEFNGTGIYDNKYYINNEC